jgi:hypothetical protein
MEPNVQHLQHIQQLKLQLNSAVNYLALALSQRDEIEARRKQQIAILEEELSQLKQENVDQKGELEKLNQKLHLQEPLLQVGVNIRRRFWRRQR